MISIADLDRIRSVMVEYGLDELTLREGEVQIRLRLAHVDSRSSDDRTAETVVRTQAMGEFLLTHPRREEPQVVVGDEVSEASIVGFLRSGPNLLPVHAGVQGQVTRIEADADHLLGFGAQVLSIRTRK